MARKDDVIRVGDRVKILVKTTGLEKGAEGKVVHIDGAYIDVRPDGFKHKVECYENELKKLEETK